MTQLSPPPDDDDPFPEETNEVLLSDEEVEALYRHIAEEERRDEAAWLARQPQHIQRLYGDTTADAAMEYAMSYLAAKHGVWWPDEGEENGETSPDPNHPNEQTHDP